MSPSETDAASWNVLRSCRALKPLSAAALRELLAAAEERTYNEGQALMTQGDPPEGLLILLEGTAHALLVGHAGADHSIGHFASGDVVGEMALVTREPRSASVIADSPVRALLVPTATFDRLATRRLELCVALTEVVADRLGQNAHDGLGGKNVEGFRILRCVGRGGMSVVYEAADEATGEIVALKMMSYRLIYDSAALARFHQEAEILQQLDHKNIARLKRLFPAYHTYFLVMELCDGIDLDALVRAHGRMAESTVRPILGQLSAALTYVHQRGLVHRDLKPHNVMMTRNGEVKLMDFGLAMATHDMDDVTRSADHSVVGTPAFMSPEQLAGGPVDSRSDVYALACLAYDLLTGQHLFEAKNLVDLVREKLTLRLPPANEIGDGVSSELYDFLQAALRVEPAERPGSTSPLTKWAAIEAATVREHPCEPLRQ